MEDRARRFVHNIPAARALRRPQTATEQLLWARLRDRGLDGLKFRRQHAVGRFVLDFYCHERRLAVEVDGGIHLLPKNRAADVARQTELESLGIRFLRVPSSLVENDIDHVLTQIVTAAATNSPSPATQESGEGAGG